MKTDLTKEIKKLKLNTHEDGWNLVRKRLLKNPDVTVQLVNLIDEYGADRVANDLGISLKNMTAWLRCARQRMTALTVAPDSDVTHESHYIDTSAGRKATVIMSPTIESKIEGDSTILREDSWNRARELSQYNSTMSLTTYSRLYDFLNVMNKNIVHYMSVFTEPVNHQNLQYLLTDQAPAFGSRRTHTDDGVGPFNNNMRYVINSICKNDQGSYPLPNRFKYKSDVMGRGLFTIYPKEFASESDIEMILVGIMSLERALLVDAVDIDYDTDWDSLSDMGMLEYNDAVATNDTSINTLNFHEIIDEIIDAVQNAECGPGETICWHHMTYRLLLLSLYGWLAHPSNVKVADIHSFGSVIISDLVDDIDIDFFTESANIIVATMVTTILSLGRSYSTASDASVYLVAATVDMLHHTMNKHQYRSDNKSMYDIMRMTYSNMISSYYVNNFVFDAVTLSGKTEWATQKYKDTMRTRIMYQLLSTRSALYTNGLSLILSVMQRNDILYYNNAVAAISLSEYVTTLSMFETRGYYPKSVNFILEDFANVNGLVRTTNISTVIDTWLAIFELWEKDTYVALSNDSSTQPSYSVTNRLYRPGILTNSDNIKLYMRYLNYGRTMDAAAYRYTFERMTFGSDFDNFMAILDSQVPLKYQYVMVCKSVGLGNTSHYGNETSLHLISNMGMLTNGSYTMARFTDWLSKLPLSTAIAIIGALYQQSLVNKQSTTLGNIIDGLMSADVLRVMSIEPYLPSNQYFKELMRVI